MAMSENDKRLQEALKGGVDEVKGRLSALTAPDLARLEELEGAGKKRPEVLEAIGAAIVAQADCDPDDSVAELAQLRAEVKSLQAENTLLQDKVRDLEDEVDALMGETGAALANEGGKGPRGETPAWQKPDYSGPLTADQALWRNRHVTRK